MINNVRNTVLSIMNKEDRGWVTPEEFNLFCAMGQLEIFEDYFHEYNRWLNAQNKRLTNSEYSDLPKNIREKIDRFSDKFTLAYDTVDDVFEVPDTLYRLEQVVYKNSIDIGEVLKRDINRLNKSNLTRPTEAKPVFIRLDNNIEVHPSTVINNVYCYGLRKPLTPKWTYLTVSGNPLFNPTADDFQDVEIHPSDEPALIIKILSYVGISLREMDIVQLLENKDSKEFQKDNS
jgi:hypothetical protein